LLSAPKAIRVIDFSRQHHLQFLILHIVCTKTFDLSLDRVSLTVGMFRTGNYFTEKHEIYNWNSTMKVFEPDVLYFITGEVQGISKKYAPVLRD